MGWFTACSPMLASLPPGDFGFASFAIWGEWRARTLLLIHRPSHITGSLTALLDAEWVKGRQELLQRGGQPSSDARPCLAQGIWPPIDVVEQVCHVFRPPTQPLSPQGWLALMCSSNPTGVQPQHFTLTDSMLDLVALMNSSCGPGTLLEGDPASVASPLGTSASRSVPKASQQGSASRLTSELWLPAACWCLVCEALLKFSACSVGDRLLSHTCMTQQNVSDLSETAFTGQGQQAALQGQLGSPPTCSC